MKSFPFLRFSSALTIISALALSACGGGTSGVPLAPSGATQSQTPGNGTAPSTSGSSITSQSITVTPKDHVLPTAKAKAHLYLTSAGYAKLASDRRTPESVTYPMDLSYFGGPFLKTARLYNAFVNSSSSAFANPNGFEEHFSYSNMSHILDQYVGTTTSNRYDWAGDVKVGFASITGIIGDDQLLEIVHAVAAAIGPNAGRKNIYNIFLPKTLNYCSTGSILPPGSCNLFPGSPNPAFCAFHTSVTFSDIGEVLFTFEPTMDIATSGLTCAANANEPNVKTPNGVFADSTYSTLSHEVSESITDPEPNNAWFTFTNPIIAGEIGDLCAYQGQTVNLAGKAYYIQREWSNKVHGCDNLQP